MIDVPEIIITENDACYERCVVGKISYRNAVVRFDLRSTVLAPKYTKV